MFTFTILFFYLSILKMVGWTKFWGMMEKLKNWTGIRGWTSSKVWLLLCFTCTMIANCQLFIGCSLPIVHRDISSKNILLDSQYKAHVSDFGIAKLLNLDSSSWTSLASTYGYFAPSNVLQFKINVEHRGGLIHLGA